MKLRPDCLLPLVLFISTLCFYLILSQSAYAEGALQGKLRENFKERLIKKMESEPAPEANASVTDKITQPGDYYFSIQHGGLTRMYLVHVPPGYNASTPAALLFAFHGGLGSMDNIANDKTYKLVSKSNAEGFVIVFPNGYSQFKSGKFATWNAGACCADARDKNIDDVGFVRAIVNNVTRQMNIDRQKIFATGMSNGGMMSERLACEMSDTFRAIASVAGTDNTIQCNPGSPISVLNIHAKDDDHVLFNGGSGGFNDKTKVTNFTSVPETISRWVNRNRCSPQPKRVLDVDGAYCDLYSSCKDGVMVKLCVTETGKHSWPGGGGNYRKDLASTALSANDEIWNFFKSLE